METISVPLKHMAKLDQLNGWIYNKIKPHLGRRILEAGCGNGNLTSFYLKNSDLTVSLDYDEHLLGDLHKRYREDHLQIVHHDLTQDLSKLKKFNIDTVVSLNTIEHIEQDELVLKNLHTCLSERGKIIIQVPAFPMLYNHIDQAVGHFRRYAKKELKQKFARAGFRNIQCFYFNLFGLPGWIFNGNILRRRYLSLSLLSLFNFLLPVMSYIERLSGPPIGLSHIVIAEK